MEVMTVKEVSTFLKIGRDQTYALMSNPTFPSYRIGKKMFVTKEALTEWLRNIKGRTILL